MQSQLDQVRKLMVPGLRANRVRAVLAVLAVAISLGMWWWHAQTKVYQLNLAAGVELKYRKELVSILCDEARRQDLVIEIQSNYRAAESIAKVSSGELDAAVIPAGMRVEDDSVRQVAMLDCEPLQLFVRPEIAGAGVAGLRGRRLNLGSIGGGARVLASEALAFMGMKAGEDFQDEAYSYNELIQLSTEQMPDGAFSLSPLPSPLGEKLVQKHGYQLLELPFGAAMALRNRTIEDITVPAHTYGARPAVPDKPMHTIGTRALLIANSNVPSAAIRRLLEVIFESDFARRAGLPPLDEERILHSVEYRNHTGTVAYLHRHDPWVNKDLVDNFMSLRVLIVSATSAVILVWQWYRRRRRSLLGDYLHLCTAMEVDALRAVLQGEFDESRLEAALKRLNELRLDALQRDQSGAFSGDQQFATLLSRLESLQQSLPLLLRAGPGSAAVPYRRAG